MAHAPSTRNAVQPAASIDQVSSITVSTFTTLMAPYEQPDYRSKLANVHSFVESARLRNRALETLGVLVDLTRQIDRLLDDVQRSVEDFMRVSNVQVPSVIIL